MPSEDDIVTTPSEVWALVHLQSNAVAQSVSKVLLKTVGLQHCSSGLVRDPRECPILGSFQGGSLSVSNSIPNLELSIREDCCR